MSSSFKQQHKKSVTKWKLDSTIKIYYRNQYDLSSMASSVMSLEINYSKLKSFILLFIIGFSPPTPSPFF